MIVTPHIEKLQLPKVIVLNAAANGIQEEILIDTGRTVNSNNKEGMDKKGPMPIPKKDTKNPIENPNVRNFEINHFLG
jgi:hypothetical protein